MSNQLSLIATLLKIQRYDAAIARLNAALKKCEQNRDGIRKQLAEAELTISALSRNLADRKRQLNSEELAIRDEQDKLVARRKSLQSLNNYKVQQAAEREIEHGSRTLSQREDSLLKSLDQFAKFEQDYRARQSALEKVRAELVEADGLVTEAKLERDEKVKAGQAERDAWFATLKPNDQVLYSKARDKYPTDSLATAVKNTCGGCFMGFSPQVLVQASKGDSIVRCSGCGRIVVAPEAAQEAAA